MESVVRIEGSSSCGYTWGGTPGAYPQPPGNKIASGDPGRTPAPGFFVRDLGPRSASLPPLPPWSPPQPLPGPIRTPRTVVRAYRPADAPALYEAVNVDRPALLPWLPWARGEHQNLGQTERTLEHFARQWADPRQPEFPMGIFDPTEREVLGGTGLVRVRPELGDAEVGYWIRGDRQGAGLATEAVGALIGAALSVWGLRRVWVALAAGNQASARVAEKLGLRLERVGRKDRWVEDRGWEDGREYAVLAGEWDAATGRGPGGAGLPAVG